MLMEHQRKGWKMKYCNKRHGSAVLFLLLILTCEANQEAKTNTVVKPTIQTTGFTTDKFILKLAETHFLNFLGVQRKPHTRMKKKVKVPSYMWKLYYQWSKGNLQTENEKMEDAANTATLYYGRDSTSNDSLPHAKMSFPLFEDRIQPDTVKKAELHLFVDPSRAKYRSRKSVDYLKVYMQAPYLEQKLIHKRRLEARSIGWHRMDVTSSVKEILSKTLLPLSQDMPGATDAPSDHDNPEHYFVADHGEKDVADHSRIHLRRRRDASAESNYTGVDTRPMLIVFSRSDPYTQDTFDLPESYEHVRQRRSYSHAENSRNREQVYHKAREQTCRIRLFNLVFNHIGWDEWIIAPKGYWINFCAGICPKPLGPHFNTTNHAVIQKSVYSIDPSLVPPLCCIPTTLREQTFLYLDGFGKIILKNPEQMIAESCGCR